MLISINTSASDMAAQLEATNSGISETFLGRNVSMESTTFIATVVGATYGRSLCLFLSSSWIIVAPRSPVVFLSIHPSPR